MGIGISLQVGIRTGCIKQLAALRGGHDSGCDHVTRPIVLIPRFAQVQVDQTGALAQFLQLQAGQLGQGRLHSFKAMQAGHGNQLMPALAGLGWISWQLVEIGRQSRLDAVLVGPLV